MKKFEFTANELTETKLGFDVTKPNGLVGMVCRADVYRKLPMDPASARYAPRILLNAEIVSGTLTLDREDRLVFSDDLIFSQEYDETIVKPEPKPEPALEPVRNVSLATSKQISYLSSLCAQDPGAASDFGIGPLAGGIPADLSKTRASELIEILIQN